MKKTEHALRADAVTLDPEAGEKLSKALRDQMNQVDSWLERAGEVARPAPLGANPVSDAMTSKFSGRAEGDRLSFVNVMTAYRTVLEQTHSAVTTAIRNFQAVDEDHQVALRRLEGGA
ncbi:hypothetical protein Lesp02_14780 [Lentzea sp. NBRC 105346]|uniref:hypothetical protein n=1 Tax=Lentzea sp. NBRC 105346 TaxID=3032205 RepID=UPI0024A15BF9|nr:hypothetical protein [Lentzea sp. NBRC 105346]GLZ29288.1 hypothetical protein Lesp02_14780 [Lentzea sp. NBRC 105346]